MTAGLLVDREPVLVVPTQWVVIGSIDHDSTDPGHGEDVKISLAATATPGTRIELKAVASNNNETALIVTDEGGVWQLLPLVVGAGASRIEIRARSVEGDGGLQIGSIGALSGGFSVTPPPEDPETTITVEPQSQTVSVGGAATFTVSATGMNLLFTVEESTDNGATWTVIRNPSTNNSYVLAGVQPSQDGLQIRFVVTGDNDPGGTPVTSTPAVLTLGVAATTLIQDVADVTVIEGGVAQFSAVASGDNLTWNVYYSSATPTASGFGGSASYTRSPVTLAGNGSQVFFEFTGADGSTVTTSLATMTVVADVQAGDVQIFDAEVTP